MQLTRGIISGLKVLFGGERGEDAWVDMDATMTPREALVRRVSRVLQIGAALNALVLLALLLLLALGGLTAEQLRPVLLGGPALSVNAAVLFGLIGITANLSVLLLLAASSGAQEWWALPLLLLLALANVAAGLLLQFFPALVALLPLAMALFSALRDPGAFHGNAVMTKELRGRMRGMRSFAIITIFLALMGSFTVLLYLLQLPRLAVNDTIITGELGRLLFIGVVGAELLLIVFIVPALTAGAITGERERKTYDLLQTTLLPASTFIMGKMESALGYILLLLLSAIPLQSISFLFGGISPTEVTISFVLLAATALVLGALGMFFSATADRTLSATVRVYTVAVGFLFGVPLISFFLFQGAFGNAIAGVRVAAASPAREALTIYGDMIAASLNPVTAAFYTQQMLIDQQEIALFQVQLSDSSFIPVVAPWILTVILYTGLAALLLLFGVQVMRRSR